VGFLHEELGEAVHGFEALFLLGQALLVEVNVVLANFGIFQGLADCAIFEALDAVQPPVAGGDALDEGLLDEAAGLELFAEVREQCVKVGLGFGAGGAGDDDAPGEQAMF
jgi:hypothetical protein